MNTEFEAHKLKLGSRLASEPFGTESTLLADGLLLVTDWWPSAAEGCRHIETRFYPQDPSAVSAE